jgi:cytochrome c-type biogenesis protein CcmH
MMTLERLRVFTLGALTASLAACGEKPAEAPRPAAAQTGIAPLSSRSDARALPPGHPPLEAARSAHAVPRRANETGTLDGVVEVAPHRRKQVREGTVFVIARSAASAEVVAVRRYDVKSFPMQFSLSAEDVMTETAVFASPFNVTARWSKSGDAMPAPGDVEGTVTNVAVGQPEIRVTLAELRR